MAASRRVLRLAQCPSPRDVAKAAGEPRYARPRRRQIRAGQDVTYGGDVHDILVKKVTGGMVTVRDPVRTRTVELRAGLTYTVHKRH